jgi:hypothetical protein
MGVLIATFKNTINQQKKAPGGPTMGVLIVMYTNNKSVRALTLVWTHGWACRLSCIQIINQVEP